MTATLDVSFALLPKAKDALPLNTIAIFCALVFGASLCLEIYGFDLSAGFF